VQNDPLDRADTFHLFIKALRVKDKRDSKLDTIDEDEEKSGHK
jgi:hypothetical protein